MTTISFPDDINGITGVGIAAGVDEFTDPAYAIAVRTKAVAGAPPAPTAAEVRAASMVRQFNSLPDDGAKATFYADDASIVATSGVERDAIIGLVDNWPANPEAIPGHPDLTANASADKVAAYDAWTAIEPMRRNGVEIDIERTFLTLDPPGTSKTAKKLWQGLLLFVIKRGWIVKDTVAGNGMIRFTGPEVAAPPTRSVDDINEIGFHGAQECANIIVAMKVTWWLINHHVGQRDGDIEGFVGKVVRLQGLWSTTSEIQNREVRNVVWSIGKMVSTRGILHAIGIKGIVYRDRSNTPAPKDNDYAITSDFGIEASPDVVLRVGGNPAGTAPTCTYFEIAKKAAYSIFGVCVPPTTSLGWDAGRKEYNGRVMEHIASIKDNPSRYHMGSHFLTGQPRLTLDSWEDEEKANLSAFIHATASGSSLAKAAVILPRAEIEGNIVYSTIQGVRTRMAEVAGNRFSVLLIGRMSGGGVTGGIARQVGRITDEDVKQVRETLQLIDEGEVSDDEGVPEGRTETAARKKEREARNDRRARRRAARAEAMV